MRLDHYLKIVLKTHRKQIFRATYKNCGARATCHGSCGAIHFTEKTWVLFCKQQHIRMFFL